MEPPQFLIGRRSDGSIVWASIDHSAHHTESETCDRRFGAYLRPFKNQESAKKALNAAGCETGSVTAELRTNRERRG